MDKFVSGLTPTKGRIQAPFYFKVLPVDVRKAESDTCKSDVSKSNALKSDTCKSNIRRRGFIWTEEKIKKPSSSTALRQKRVLSDASS